jgi:steroid 5-alpha reductase family enzyme
MAASSPNTPLNIIDAIAAVSLLTFLVIETVADNQQFRFQQQKRSLSDPDPAFALSLKRGFLSDGLWGYVRHPNFVAEQAIWISFYFFGVAATGLWLNFSMAGALLLVLLFIGSTRLTEKISSGKYPDYRYYQKEVPRFIPSLKSIIRS